MKENARKLRLLSRLIDLSMFHSVTIDTGSISLWGEYTSEMARFLNSRRFSSLVSVSGNVVFHRSNLFIFLS